MDLQATEALIEIVKAHPILYKKQPIGGTVEQKNTVWAEVAEKLNQPVGNSLFIRYGVSVC